MGGSLLIDLARFWAVYVFTGLVLVVLSTAKRDILSQQNDLFYLHDNGVTILCPDAPVGSWDWWMVLTIPREIERDWMN